jgi:Effector Associated Constant Component 1
VGELNVTVGVAAGDLGASEVAEQTRSLFGWLAEEDELRGRVRLVEADPVPGTLGTLPTELMVALAPGGAGTILAGAVIAWIRHRTGEVTCTVTRPDGAYVSVSGTRVRAADTAELGRLVGPVPAALDGIDGRVAPEGGDRE